MSATLAKSAADPTFNVNSWVPRDVVLRDAWFPLAHDWAVGEGAIRRVVHSQLYFLWRDASGTAIAAEHHPNADPATRRHISAFTGGTGFYPVIERWGYVWAWYGDPANADELFLPDVPYLPRNGGLPRHMTGTVRFDCTSSLSLENLIDLTHADFLHASVVGDERSETDHVEVFSTSETVTMVRTCTKKTVAPIMRYVGGTRAAKVQDVRAVIHIYLRSHVALAFGRYKPGFDVPLFHPCVPMTRDRCRLDFAMNTSQSSAAFRHVMPKSSFVISEQDNLMTRPQNARYMQPTPRRDLHSRFDAPGQRYRAAMQALAVRQAAGDYSYQADGIVSQDCSELIGVDRRAYNAG